MKIGISSYCLNREIKKGRMTLHQVIDWAAAAGAECIELVPFSFRFDDPDTGKIDEAAINAVKKQARDAGIEIVNYSVLADFCKEGEALEAEIKRVEGQIDIAAALGTTRMRHDVSGFRRPQLENTGADFDRWLPVMAGAARRLTQYGKERGVKTMIENHGFFANGCDRVDRILRMVNDDNYGLLLDTGNVICVDEDPTVAAGYFASRARMVHLKDFYIRQRDPGNTTQFDCEGSWFCSRGGKYLRGSILNQGDLDVYATLGALKHAGYDGNIAIEFEGFEEAQYATAVSLANARRIWDEV